MKKNLISLAFLMLGVCVFSTASAEDKTSYLMCKNKEVVRTIRVQKNAKGVCTATYTKDGVDSIVGKSTSEETCQQVMANIQANLEKANWQCRDISEARVSSSVE